MTWKLEGTQLCSSRLWVFKLAQLKRESQFLINLLRAAQCVADEVEMCLSSICLHVTVSLFTKFDFIAFQIYCMEVVRGFWALILLFPILSFPFMEYRVPISDNSWFVAQFCEYPLNKFDSRSKTRHPASKKERRKFHWICAVMWAYQKPLKST